MAIPLLLAVGFDPEDPMRKVVTQKYNQCMQLSGKTDEQIAEEAQAAADAKKLQEQKALEEEQLADEEMRRKHSGAQHIISAVAASVASIALFYI